MNLSTLWPAVCMRCGSLKHSTQDCDKQQQFGLSDQERAFKAQARSDKQALIFAVVAIALALTVISVLSGVPA